jgi:hypothetical protein
MNEDRIPKVLNTKPKRKSPSGRSRWEQHLQKGGGRGRQKGKKEGMEGERDTKEIEKEELWEDRQGGLVTRQPT